MLRKSVSLWGGVTTPVSDFRGERMPRFTTDGGPIDMTLALRLRLETRVMLDAFGLLLPAGAYRWDLEVDGKPVRPSPFAVEVDA